MGAARTVAAALTGAALDALVLLLPAYTSLPEHYAATLAPLAGGAAAGLVASSLLSALAASVSAAAVVVLGSMSIYRVWGFEAAGSLGSLLLLPVLVQVPVALLAGVGSYLLFRHREGRELLIEPLPETV